ncbi:hypothetical protein L1987_25818 [Smallanthus sonchifolius]|uniref:Uncharacterized protein n=1 Tax=Smallanthus sonchifolius TaxID=185202 RepID=A0ACB9IA30_9ASTR|nr:hypothetical protein L1987_25818 [Smallanthus sonchifolius]
MECDGIESVDLQEEKGAKKAEANRERKDRAIAWQYFTKLKQLSIDGKTQCLCNKCKYLILYDSTQAALVKHELPLSFVDYTGFRELFTYLQPDVNIITRNIVKSDLLKMYKREKEKVKNMLIESPERLCLTSDLWTSIANDGEYNNVEAYLHSTFNEYVMSDAGNDSFTTSNVASSPNATNEFNDTRDDSTCAYGVRARLKLRFARNSEVDMLAFGKANEFRYPILTKMARDFLTIPISTVVSESTFSASGRILDQHRSSLSKDTVEALICTKDWLFADCCSNEVNLNELTEDVMFHDIIHESNASNLVRAIVCMFETKDRRRKTRRNLELSLMDVLI